MPWVVEGSLLVLVTCLIWQLLRPTITVKDKKELGVARASMIYSDEKGTKMLYAKALNIQGKPDMIFETWLLKRYIPLEIKSGVLKEEMPHLGDVYQLVAYFLIIEEAYGKRPPYGKLVYANKTFVIRNTKKLRNKVTHMIQDMREMITESYHPHCTPDYMKCKHCVCRETVCEWIEGGTHGKTTKR